MVIENLKKKKYTNFHQKEDCLRLEFLSKLMPEKAQES